MRSRDFLLPCSLGCMLYGIWLSFCEIFSCGVSDGSYLLPAFSMAVLLVILLLPWSRGTTLAILAVGAMFWFLAAALHIRRLLREIRGLLYYIDRAYYEYFEVHLYSFGKKCSMDNTLLWIFLGILSGVFLTLFVFRMRSRSYGFLPCYLVVVLGLFMGRAPGVKGMLFLAVGIVLALFWCNGQDRGGVRHFQMRRVEKQGREWHRYALFLLVLAIVLLAAGQLTRKTGKRILSYGERVQRIQASLETKIVEAAEGMSEWILGDAAVDSDGTLDNEEPKYRNKRVMKITLPQRPKGDIYLRGFVGSRYESGEWTEDGKKFVELFPDREIRESLMELGYDELHTWRSHRLEDDSWEETSGSDESQEEYDSDDDSLTEVFNRSLLNMPTQEMEIEYVGAGKHSQFTYLPYFSRGDAIMDVNTVEYIQDLEEEILESDTSRKRVTSHYTIPLISLRNDQMSYYYNNYRGLLSGTSGEMSMLGTGGEISVSGDRGSRYYYDFSDLKGCPLRGDESQLKSYLKFLSSHFSSDVIAGDDVQKYMKYAWEEYGYRGESSFFERKEFLRRLRKYNYHGTDTNYTAGMDTMDRAELVQSILWSMAGYSTQLEAVPEGADYAEYFLLTQKRGYCEHFATAGTLLMRELGIPSRYVGGYRIPANRFEADGDGGYTAWVLDSDAHAWTEVLAGHRGWFPVEMTPSDDGAVRNQNPATDMPAVTAARATSGNVPSQPQEERETPAAKTPPPSAAATAAPVAEKKKSGALAGKSSGSKTAAGGAAAFAGGLAGIVLLLLWRRVFWRRRTARLARIREKSPNVYVRMALHDLLAYLRKCGVPVSGKMPERQWLSGVENLWNPEDSSGEALSGRDRAELLRIVQKAAFSRDHVTQEELKDFQTFCGRLEQAARCKAGRLRRAYLKVTGRCGTIP